MTTWQEHTDDSLIEHAASHRDFAGPAAMEMQRRLMVAIQAFKMSSDRSAFRMLWLTVMIAVLAAIQVAAAFPIIKSIKPADTPRPTNSVATVPTSSPVFPTSRYAFYIDPTTTQNALGGGFVLDTTTGELWTVGIETANGKLGGRILIPVRRVGAPQNK